MQKTVLGAALSLIILTCLQACTFESDDVWIDEREDEECFVGDYYVDEQGNEGVIGYVPGQYNITSKFYIVISADEVLLPWGPMDDSVCPNDTVTAGMGQNPAFGLSLMQIMKLRGMEKYPAMAWCYKKNFNGEYPNAGSWRLPTRFELGLIFGSIKNSGDLSSEIQNRLATLNKALNDIGGTKINSGRYYWTCLEDYQNLDPSLDLGNGFDRKNRAWAVNTENMPPGDKDMWLKKNNYYVRAIKYIYYERKY